MSLLENIIPYIDFLMFIGIINYERNMEIVFR